MLNNPYVVNYRCDVIKLSVLKEHCSPKVLKGSYSWLFDLTELSVMATACYFGMRSLFTLIN